MKFTAILTTGIALLLFGFSCYTILGTSLPLAYFIACIGFVIISVVSTQSWSYFSRNYVRNYRVKVDNGINSLVPLAAKHCSYRSLCLIIANAIAAIASLYPFYCLLYNYQFSLSRMFEYGLGQDYVFLGFFLTPLMCAISLFCLCMQFDIRRNNFGRLISIININLFDRSNARYEKKLRLRHIDK